MSNNTTTAKSDSFTVYIFLLEDCPISQYYIPKLNELHENYCNDNLTIIGLFPNKLSTKNTIQVFENEYNIQFELKTDRFQKITQKYQATVTPEIIVVNTTKDAVVYQGRIDNTFHALGKRRTVTTTNELEEVLISVQLGKEVKISQTEAIGCLIQLVK